MVQKLDLFDQAKYLPKINGKFDTLSSPFLRKLRTLSTSTTKRYNNVHLDEISLDQYGTESLFWVVGYYNKIINPYIEGAVVISLPSLSDIESLMLKYKGLYD